MTEVRDVGDLDIMRECSALSSVRLLDYYGLCGSRTWGSEERVLGVGMLWVAEGRGSGDKAVARYAHLSRYHGWDHGYSL
jgi:hypothetical protein